MSSEISQQGVTRRRQLVFVVLGIFLLGAACLLTYDRLHVHTSIAPLPAPYTYNIRQTVHDQVSYHQSSFFSTTPDPSNTAFLADLTDSIAAQFGYNFQGSERTQLSYLYYASAAIRATSGSAQSAGGVATVWSKQYQLIGPTSGTRDGTSISVNPQVRIPFAQYKAAMDSFKDAFNAPLNSELVITYTVQVSGKVNGTPFTDTKVSSISTSLDQEVYQLAVKYDKTDHQVVFPTESRRLVDTITTYEVPVAIILTIAGLAYVVYGFRRQIFKTPYMRELEKIYRYHDGIIIRASRPTNLSGKNIVPVQSFDDLLNIEEETKSPIVASPAGDRATQFMIARDDIVYVFTLGEQIAVRQPATTTAPVHDVKPPEHHRPESKGRITG